MPIPDSELPIAITLRGEYDIFRQEELRAELASARVAPSAVLDMHEVTYIDASALREFVALKKSMPQPAVVYMIGTNRHIRKVLEITRLTKMFAVQDALEATAQSHPSNGAKAPKSVKGTARLDRQEKTARS